MRPCAVPGVQVSPQAASIFAIKTTHLVYRFITLHSSKTDFIYSKNRTSDSAASLEMEY